MDVEREIAEWLVDGLVAPFMRMDSRHLPLACDFSIRPTSMQRPATSGHRFICFGVRAPTTAACLPRGNSQ